MKSTFEKKENAAVFKVSLDKDEWEAELNGAYNRNKKRYKVPGFRPGKAPRRFIEMHYGAGVFFDAAVDACIQRAYVEELGKHPELHTFGSPEVSFDKPEGDDAFAFTLTVTLYPEAKLGEYKGMKLRKIEYNVSDEDLQTRIDAELKHAARFVTVDRPAALGDTVVIDYVGSVDGVPFEGGSAQKHELKLGSGSFIPGFEDGLVGTKAGDERDVNVTFPEEYHAENLKGKPAVFKCKVHEVRAEEVPALDDTFVKEHTKYETVDEYKTGLKADLEKQAKDRERNERIDAALNAAVDNAECDVPDKMVNAEVERMYEEFAHQLSHYGMKPEDYLKYSDSSPEKFRAERREPAARNVKVRQVMHAIIEAEKLEVTDEEAQTKLDSDAEFKHRAEHEAEHHGYDLMELVKNDMLTDKFFDFLLASNEFVLDADEKPEDKKPADEKKKSTEKKPAADKPATAKKTTAKKPAAKKPADGDSDK